MDSPGYGALKNSPRPPACHVLHEETGPPVSDLDDPRHKGDSPTPWLRYFFPKDFEVREGSAQYKPYYHFFDVTKLPLQEDASVPPPAWTPNAYYRLSFTQHHHHNHPQHSEAMPDHTSPLDAVDITAGNLLMFREGVEQHLGNMVAFVRSVASFSARTWKDALPLVDLLRGVLLYLLGQMQAGMAVMREYALRDALASMAAEREQLTASHAQAMAAAKAEWSQDMEKKLGQAREGMRKQLAEEMAAQQRALSEDRDRWIKKAQAAELQVKQLNETVTALEREVASLESQLASERAASARALAGKEDAIRALNKQLADAQARLGEAREVVVQGLGASSSGDVMKVAVRALGSLLPGTHVYAAELTTRADIQGVRTSMAKLAAHAEQEGQDSAFAKALQGLEPAYLKGPLAPGASVSPSHPLKPSDFAAELVALDSITPESMQQQLCLAYTHSSADQAFMRGKQLEWGKGVTWGVAQGGGQEVFVEDVKEEEGVHLFGDHAKMKGSYLALPLMGSSGELVGVLGLDTLQPAATQGHPPALDDSSIAFARQLAQLVNQAVAKDQRRYEDLMQQAFPPPEPPVAEQYIGPVAPDAYADLAGGLAMYKSAVEMMRKLGAADITAFQEMTSMDDATLAVVRSALAAAGQAVGQDWTGMRSLITRDLMTKLAAMDPQAAWAEWQALCAAFRPVIVVEKEVGQLGGLLGDDVRSVATPDGSGGRPGSGPDLQDEGAGLRTNAVGRALGRWVDAVRKISAANALRVLLDAKLKRANEQLIRTFEGEGSNALTELRSYRVPPKYTFLVLQAVLTLAGSSEDDVHNWGRMRVLTNYKLIRRLVELKPADVTPKVVKIARRVTSDVDEADVRKESNATLALFRWLVNFTGFSELA
ncbi:radial spoke protein 17 [Haematococcus lacustris]